MFYRLPLLLILFACSGDKSSSPGDDLVGTWRLISSSDEEMQALLSSGQLVSTSTHHPDGTFTDEITQDGLTISVSGTWDVVGGRIVQTLVIDGRTKVVKADYSVRSNRLTLIFDSGETAVYERS